MSKKNRQQQRETMETTNTQEPTEVVETTPVFIPQPQIHEEHQTPPVADTVDTPIQDSPIQDPVREPEPIVPAQPKPIHVGTIVEPNQGKLGQQASSTTQHRVNTTSTAKPDIVSTPFEQKIAKINTSGSTREKFVIASIQSYIDQIGVGRPIDIDVGVRAQQSLYRTILNIVNSDEDFTNAFKLLIAFVREHRTGVFADTHAFRFFEFAKPGQEWTTTLSNLLALLIVASGVNNKRDVHSIIKVSKAVQTGLSEAARQRIIQYFN